MAKVGRPRTYNEEILVKTQEYIDMCGDEIDDYHKTRGKMSDSYDRIVKVNLPTIEGLAVYLDVNKDTIYTWRKEFKEFSDLIDKLLDKQARELINKGLSGDYNPTIAKVLLTKHGYREAIDSENKNTIQISGLTPEDKAILDKLFK